MNGVIHLTILFLLACYSAFSASHAVPAPPKQINKVTIQTYTPDIYKKKRQRQPIRRKMVLVSQVNLQADESTESQSSGNESQHISAAALEIQKDDFLFWAVRDSLGFHTYLENWPFYCLPPDSPPPQLPHGLYLI